MKTKLLMLMSLIVVALFSVSAFAQDGGIIDSILNFIPMIVSSVGSIPKVGPVLVHVINIVGGIAGICTVLATAAISFFKLPQVAFYWANANKLGDKFGKGYEKSKPVIDKVAKLSVYNVQKPEKK